VTAREDAAGLLVRLSAVKRENIGLRMVPVAIRPLEKIIQLPGVIKPHPDRVALVTSRTGGTILDIHASVGDRVSKGQGLIQIQSGEVEKLGLDLVQAENKYRAERARLELNLAQAETKLGLAQSDVSRFRSLVDKGIGARKDLIASESRLEAIQNEIAGLNRERELLAQASGAEIVGLTRQLGLLGLPGEAIERLRGEKRVPVVWIPAPLGGIIVQRPVSPGQVIDRTTTLLEVVDDSVVIAEGSAYQDLLPSLRVGQNVRLTTAAYQARVFEGVLTVIHPVIDAQRRTARVWAEIPNQDHALKPGILAQLSVVIGGRRPVLTVPVGAVMAAEGAEFVFVEKEGGFARVEITTGIRNDQFVEVTRGLEPGNGVVTDGKLQVYTKLLTLRRGAAPVRSNSD
jgi:multidrug efflux pump subunit AcrA (membrane-fusion protein)